MHTVKSRTWHRSNDDSTVPVSDKGSGSNSAPSHSHIFKGGKPKSTSYIRKGNSLVRNHSPVVAVSKDLHDSKPVAPRPGAEKKKRAFSEIEVDLTVGHNGSGKSDDLVSIPKYEACQLLEKTTSRFSNCSPVESAYISPLGAVINCRSESKSGPIRTPDDIGFGQFHGEMKLDGTVENRSVLINSLSTQTAADKGNSLSLNRDSILKHNSYQLDAASGPSHLPVEKAQNTQILSSDGYCKTQKNQIIRTPLDIAQPVPVSINNFNTEGPHAQNMASRTSISQSYKVWTLQGAQPISKKTHDQVQCRRATSWREIQNSGASLNSRSLLMLRKLTLYRSQNTVYKRSIHGLSLRKYKVVALNGRSLKWSKSIGRRSKKASEDATHAVVAAETRKREQSRLQRAMSREKKKHHSFSKSAHCVTQRPRGRIFRIGSVRYRMDPSRNTLQRVIGDDGSQPGALEAEDFKRVYVPRRLVIGKDEYIRTGNGNQLIRDPKKRIRMLANEKIKWSLHNVRLRSIKKRRFCQFYTRFGKCNKDDGKCAFIHDSSKIAVCTKFLKGICSEHNCKLTHEIIPERMEDCSYFLQGMCSNENCPYRHVNVNPNATACEGFLKGYCADGDECQKKHSYVCHVYEETGSCLQGSKCRLHHPKKQKAKQTSSRMQRSTKGRYFRSPPLEVSGSQNLFMKHSTTSSANISQDEDIPDFISLYVGGDGDDNSTKDAHCASTNVDNAMYTEAYDLDTLIKPVGIMNRDLVGISLPNQA